MYERSEQRGEQATAVSGWPPNLNAAPMMESFDEEAR